MAIPGPVVESVKVMMPSTSAPDHAKKEAFQYLNGFGENFLTSCMHTMPFSASYTGGLS